MAYFDYENPKYQGGFEPLERSEKAVKDVIGLQICYLQGKDIDRSGRGIFFPRYGYVENVQRGHIYFSDGNAPIRIKDLVELAVRKTNK